MSQITTGSSGSGPIPGTYVETLTGNSGVATASGHNINVVAAAGDGLFTGAGSTLTYTLPTTVPEDFVTDSGTAVPALGVLDINGAHNINTSGAGNQVVIHGNNTITLGDLASVAGADAITVTTGNISVTAGTLNLPNTNGAGTQGIINFGGNPMLSNFGTDNFFVGGAGNTTVTGNTNYAFGLDALHLVTTGTGNVAIGESSMNIATTAGANVALGAFSLDFLGTGGYNIALGINAGTHYTGAESSNALLGNPGVLGESNVMRLGATGSGNGQVNKAYIAATYGTTPAVSGTNEMVISNNLGQLGTQAIPTPPAASVNFLAKLSAQQSNVTGDGTDYTIICDSVRSNVGAAYNNATGTFAAPNTGLYQFSWGLLGLNFTAAYNQIQVELVTTSGTWRLSEENAGVVFDVNGFISLSGSVFVNLTATDIAFLQVLVTGGTKTIDIYGQSVNNDVDTWFSGYQVA